MTQMDYTLASKYFHLQDFWKAFGLTTKYFLSPKAALNDPYEQCLSQATFLGKYKASDRLQAHQAIGG